MKNILPLVVVLVLAFPVLSRAVEREAQHVYEGETYFEKVGATGNQQTGNPGYIVLTTVDTNGITFSYYLWVSMLNGVGKLVLASYAPVSAFTSFPLGDWRMPNFTSGTVVGTQS